MNDERSTSGVPPVSLAPLLLPTISDIAPEVSRLKVEAARRGFGTLVYLLDQAERECARLARVADDDKQACETDPDQFWRPRAR